MFSLGNGSEVFISDSIYVCLNRFLNLITREKVEMGREEEGLHFSISAYHCLIGDWVHLQESDFLLNAGLGKTVFQFT